MWADRPYLPTLLLVLVACALAGCGARGLEVAPTANRAAGDAERQFADAVDLVANLHYAEAAERFVELAALFEDLGHRPRAAESLFWLGYCREKQGLAAEAEAAYHRVVLTYAETPAARQASERLQALGQAPVRN
jgi:TolA-binding protein